MWYLLVNKFYLHTWFKAIEINYIVSNKLVRIVKASPVRILSLEWKRNKELYNLSTLGERKGSIGKSIAIPLWMAKIARASVNFWYGTRSPYEKLNLISLVNKVWLKYYTLLSRYYVKKKLSRREVNQLCI